VKEFILKAMSTNFTSLHACEMVILAFTTYFLFGLEYKIKSGTICKRILGMKNIYVMTFRVENATL
jgi:hypothetical protein